MEEQRSTAALLHVRTLAALIFLFVPISLHADEPVSIGLLAELSGTNAANGLSCRQGYELARAMFAPGDTVGARRVQFLFGDHKGDARTGVAEFTRIVAAERAAAVITTRAQVAMALNPLSRKGKIPLFGILGHSRFTAENPYAFQFWPTTTVEGAMLARKVLALKKQNIGIVSLEDEWPLSLAQQFEKTLVAGGGRVAASVTVGPQETDFSSIAAKMKAANPGAIFVNMTIAQSGLVIRKLREQGLSQQLFSNLYGSFKETIVAAGQNAIEGLIFVAPDMNRPKFSTAFRGKFSGAVPNATAYSCFSGLAAILQAAAADASVLDGPSLFGASSAMKEVRLPDEILPVTDRQAQFKLIYKTIRNGEIADF